MSNLLVRAFRGLDGGAGEDMAAGAIDFEYIELGAASAETHGIFGIKNDAVFNLDFGSLKID